MASSYPGSFDSFPTITADKLLSDAVGGRAHRAMHNDLGDVIEAVQAELGLDPAGAAATVAARLANQAMYNVKDYGAAGNDSTDDTTAIQSAITAAGTGGTIVVPPGTYMINAVAGNGVAGTPVGLRMTQSKQTLRLMSGATLKAIAISGSTHSAVLQVSAADCLIEGPGTIMGTIGRHTSDSSEWHYGLDVNAGADRLTVRNLVTTKCFGDGIFIMGRPADVHIVNCRSVDNRRQGMSIIDALRPQVIGGAFTDTGKTAYIGPGAGIDIEPDAATSRDVIDFLISGVTTSGNAGAGIMVSSNGRTARGVITDCISTGDALQETSGAAAFWALGAGNLTRFVGCLARGSARGGFASTGDTSDIVFEGCTSENNTERGFLLDGTRPTAISCMARGNAYAGFYIDSTAAGAYLSGCIAHSCASGADDIQFHIYGDDTLLTNCVSDAGATTPNYAFAVRTGAAGTRLFGCSARGSFGSGAWLDQVGDAVAFPLPGVTLKPTVSGSRSSNAALADLLTELATLGLIVNSTS